VRAGTFVRLRLRRMPGKKGGGQGNDERRERDEGKGKDRYQARSVDRLGVRAHS